MVLISLLSFTPSFCINLVPGLWRATNWYLPLVHSCYVVCIIRPLISSYTVCIHYSCYRTHSRLFVKSLYKNYHQDNKKLSGGKNLFIRKKLPKLVKKMTTNTWTEKGKKIFVLQDYYSIFMWLPTYFSCKQMPLSQLLIGDFFLSFFCRLDWRASI